MQAHLETVAAAIAAGGRHGAVSEDIMAEWRHLNEDEQKLVAQRVEDLWKQTELSANSKPRGPKPAPKSTKSAPVAPVQPNRTAIIEALVTRPGGATLDELREAANTPTPHSFISNLRERHNVRREYNENGRIVRYYVEPEKADFFRAPSDKPLSRSDRGVMGGRAARRSRRMPGTFDSEAMRYLDDAGEQGLTIHEWADKLHTSTGSMYRRITTLRNRGYHIETLRHEKSRWCVYVSGARPQQEQSSLNLAPLDSPPPEDELVVEPVAQTQEAVPANLENLIKENIERAVFEICAQIDKDAQDRQNSLLAELQKQQKRIESGQFILERQVDTLVVMTRDYVSSATPRDVAKDENNPGDGLVDFWIAISSLQCMAQVSAAEAERLYRVSEYPTYEKCRDALINTVRRLKRLAEHMAEAARKARDMS